MGISFHRLAVLSPILAVAGLAGAAALSPAASAQSQHRDYGGQALGTFGGADIEPRAAWQRAAGVPDRQFLAYFRQIAGEMDRQNPLAPAGDPHALRLARLTKGLDSYDGLKLDIRAYLVDDVYAFALGDGTVRVSSGLMDTMSDDEVRCVIGHELGHARLQHGENRLRNAMRQDAALTVSGTPEGAERRLADAKLGGLVRNVIYAPYSRSAEIASDEYALGFMADQGYDRAACASAMDKLAARGASDGNALFHTHLHSAARAKRIRKEIG